MKKTLLGGMLDKAPSDFNFEEASLMSTLLFDYLKNDGIMDDLSEKKRRLKLPSGHTIQHVNYFVVSEINDTPWGFQDEIVYVGTELNTGKLHFLGMEWNNDNNVRLQLARELSNDDKDQIVLSIMTHNALSRTIKPRP